MDAIFFKNNPFRRPQWRAERAMQMAEHRPNALRPQRYDDRYVRAYRRFLLKFMAAGENQVRRHSVCLQMPHVYQAHSLYLSPDPFARDVLEAWFLTGQSPDQIASRFAMESATIDHYEKLFFHMRDRLQCSDWILKIIRGAPSFLANDNDQIADDEVGFLLRLFAFRGGPLVLETLVAGIMSEKMARPGGDIDGWFHDALAHILRTRGTNAAGMLAITRDNVLRLLRQQLP